MPPQSRISSRAAALILAALTVASWGVLAWELGHHGFVSPPTVATVLTLTTMLVAWPFLMGVRVSREGVTHLRSCGECGGASRAFDLGFCLRCGAAGKAIGLPVSRPSTPYTRR